MSPFACLCASSDELFGTAGNELSPSEARLVEFALIVWLGGLLLAGRPDADVARLFAFAFVFVQADFCRSSILFVWPPTK